MPALAEIKEEQEAVQYSEWVLKWQVIESDMMFNVPWRKLYQRATAASAWALEGSWITAEKKFWAEYLRFVTEVYHYGGTLEELKRRITDQRIYNKSVKGVIL